MSDELSLLQRRFDRERLARKAAEAALEQESLKLYHANEQLTVANSRLETEVVEQTVARRQMEARAAGIVEAALDAVIATDAAGRVVAWNRKAEDIFGWTEAEASGHSLSELIVPAADRVPPRGLALALSGNDAPGHRVEADAVRRDGRTLAVEVSISSVSSSADRVLSIFVRDISERVQFERRRLMMYSVAGVLAEAATVAEARDGVLSTVIRTLGWDVGMSWRLDADGTLRFAGHSTDVPTRVPLVEASREFVFTAGVGLPGRVLESGQPAWVIDLRRDDNYPRWPLALASGLGSGVAVPISSNARVIGVMEFYFKDHREPDGDLLSVLVSLGNQFGQFIERRRAEEAAEHARREAEQASAAKSEFLAKMSHEIRTPLNGIVGIVELMGNTSLDEQQQRFLKIAKGSSESLLSIINDVLDFSKIEAGAMDLEAIPFAPGRVLEEVVDSFASQAEKKGLELGAAIAPVADLTFVGDPGRFRQVLVNLVGNAIKFTKSGRVIARMGLNRAGPGGVLRVEVDDSGIGIAPDKVGRLFQSFSQADASTTRTYGGTGLGLAISKRLVEMMGGTIGVRANSVAGTTFWFTADLPAAADARPATPPTRLRVLTVDTNAVVAQMLDLLLSQWDCVSDSAADTSAAMDKLRSAYVAGTPFDVALVGLSLPGHAGRSLNQWVRADVDLRGTRLVAIGGISERMDGASLGRADFDAAVTKPLNPSRLQEALAVRGGRRKASAVAETCLPQTRDDLRAPPGARVLVAEDNEVNQFIIRKMLASRGYACEMVGNGRAAVETASARDFALVLMDCSMPEMDGFEATRQIRAIEAADQGRRRLPIVALTAEALNGDREKCRAVGMDDYVSKPIEPVVLFSTILRLISAAPPPPRAAEPSPPATKNSAVPVDYAALLDRSLGDDAFAQETLDLFLDRAEQDLAAVRKGVDANAVAEVGRIAHGLKGAAGHIGAVALCEAAAVLESLAREQNAGMDAPLRQLAEAVAEASAYIRQTLLTGKNHVAGTSR